MALSRCAPLAALALTAALTAAAVASPTAALATSPSHSPIAGSGSSWASSLVNQWISDVTPNGLSVTYTATGSAVGRSDFAHVTTDFGVTDVPYSGLDPVTGDNDSSDGRDYAGVPIAAGGMAFPVHLERDGSVLTDVRLSGATLAGIFTNQITRWDDAAVTADNNGHALPAEPIVPVVHSEGSAVSYEVSRYLAAEFPTDWTAYNGSASPTAYWPRQGDQLAESGSDGVINAVTSSAGEGMIGMDQYAYAVAKDWPVAKVENAAGYYTLPHAVNVEVALHQASPDATTGAADLSGVYTSSDPLAYPLSAYSTLLLPTSATDARMTTAKRQTLEDFTFYGLCQGQGSAAVYGDAPLPSNLVQTGFSQLDKLKAADAGVDTSGRDLSHCSNPTVDASDATADPYAASASAPKECDKTGHGPCSQATSVPTLTVSPTALNVGSAATVTLKGTPGDLVTLLAASRPSTELVTVRRLTVGSHGTVTTTVAPRTNTELVARTDAGDSTPKTLYVRPAESLKGSASGHVGRLSGQIVPGHGGVTVRLFTVKAGKLSLVGTATTGSNGAWSYQRTFAASGAVTFLAQTLTDSTSLSGQSNRVTVRFS